MLRIDVLTWDIEDSRHNVRGRSDIRNLRRMYYFLFGDVLRKRGPDQAVWQVFPDESSAEPWSHLLYLSEVLDWNTGDLVFEINVVDVIPCISHCEPLIQVADLFAGLAVYSRTSYDIYERWKLMSASGNQVSRQSAEFTKSHWERCQVLEYFDGQCKGNKLGVSLRQGRGLHTFNPNKPVNFWWYESRAKGDVAPTW
jgi:hypothetical protein